MGTGMKLSLGRAAKAGGASKATLLKALGAGELTGTKGSDGVWAIDSAEVARWRENREKPQRGRRPAPPEAPAPKVDHAALQVELRMLREKLDEMIEREKRAEGRAERAEGRAERALEEERAAKAAWNRLIEDQSQRPKGLWARLTGR
jgi:hypothetical protein